MGLFTGYALDRKALAVKMRSGRVAKQTNRYVGYRADPIAVKRSEATNGLTVAAQANQANQ